MGGDQAGCVNLTCAHVVSIHAPAWGATGARLEKLAARKQFQSTPPRGGRRKTLTQRRTNPVSIHAPAWGATRDTDAIRVQTAVFQSTPPRGGRRTTDRGAGMDKEFQSTPPRGGRQPDMFLLVKAFRFQSTPPRGGRRTQAAHDKGQSARVSIHAPAWGATHEHRDVNAQGGPVSIHAPAWGATLGRRGC